MVENDLSLQLNPREVLAYLNELGIRNVSSEMLKEFMKDLKKLIRIDQAGKYGERNIEKENLNRIGLERLHSCSTFSSRCKSVNHPIPQRKRLTCVLPATQSNVNVSHSNSCKRASSAKDCERVPIKRAPLVATAKSTVNVASTRSSNLIKVPKVEKPKKSDPVSLYHYYNSLWDKYKSNLPGENSWADLRWSIREKLAGAVPEKSKPIVTGQTKEMLAKRREGWIE